mmetsp:Transcript_31140/g.62253  ORF Transcript_31140/g.62253 Transcript_31140/m.62253 type:complete len:423 (-) Transcript_31140:132-1400(-)
MRNNSFPPPPDPSSIIDACERVVDFLHFVRVAYNEIEGPLTFKRLSLAYRVMFSALNPWRNGSDIALVGNLKVGSFEEIGHRPTLEDRVVFKELNIKSLKKRGVKRVLFFAVYDGHGGQEASTYLHKNLHVRLEKALGSQEVAARYTKDSVGDSIIVKVLAEVFAQVDVEFFAKEKEKAMTAGSTAATLLLVDDRLYAANVGDSRVVLSRSGASVALTQDHKPSLSSEAQRIKSRGGFVMKGRVCGELAVARAFGDFRFKAEGSLKDLLDEDQVEEMGGGGGGVGSSALQPLVISDPEVKCEVLSPAQDEFFMLACDGLFDVNCNEDAIGFVRAQLTEHGDPAKAAKTAAKEALRKGSRDNVSVLVVVLQDLIAKPPLLGVGTSKTEAAAAVTPPSAPVSAAVHGDETSNGSTAAYKEQAGD